MCELGRLPNGVGMTEVCFKWNIELLGALHEDAVRDPLKPSVHHRLWPERARARLITVDKSITFCASSRMEIRMFSADLGKQLESYIQQLVDTGRYGSKSEVLREGVRLVQDRETRLAALDASIMRGISDADSGRTKSASDVFNRLDAKYRAMADKAENSA